MPPNRPALRTSLGSLKSLPLGIAGFAMTTFVLSVFNAGFFGGTEALPAVLGLAIFYGGIAQFAAGMWEFVCHNTFTAAAFGGYGTSGSRSTSSRPWASRRSLPICRTRPPQCICSGGDLHRLHDHRCVAGDDAGLRRFITLTPTYVLLVFGFLYGNTEIIHIGGHAGIATAVAAWYAAFAGVTNATFGRTIIPTGLLNA